MTFVQFSFVAKDVQSQGEHVSPAYILLGSLLPP